MGILGRIFTRGKAPAHRQESRPPGTGSESDRTPEPEPAEMDAEEAKILLRADDDVQLLDVREPAELESEGWIPGRIHIPMNAIPERMRELDPGRPVLVYCAHGMRSYNVAAYLLQNGFQSASSLSGGLAAWTGEREFPPA